MKKGLYNLVFGILGQVVILALGILVPRFVLKSYGDEANGLINAIGQVFTYIALIEAGVGQAALQALYRPIVNEEYGKTNAVLSATQRMFRRLTHVYIAFVVAIACLYPLFIHVEDTQTIRFFGSTYWAVFSIILVQGISNAVNFYFLSTLKQLLIADGRNYIIVNVTTLIRVLTSVLRIVLINLRTNIVVLQLVYLAMAIIEILIYKGVFKKRYLWLNLNEKPDGSALAQRNSFVVHEICNVIFSSTDVLVLSLFCSLNAASIYAVYNLVFSAINALISQVHSGCFYILGQTYSKDATEYEKVHDAYDTYYMAFVFSLISTAYICILPFIRLYTDGVTELDYIDPYLPILFCAIQLLSCCRITSSNLIKLAGHAKQTVTRAIAEAVINLATSLILVRYIGMYGVLIGTIAALVYRTNDMIIYANTRILKRMPFKTYGIILTNALLFLGLTRIGNPAKHAVFDSFVEFFVFAGAICAGSLLVFCVINALANRTTWKYVYGLVLQRVQKRQGGTR